MWPPFCQSRNCHSLNRRVIIFRNECYQFESAEGTWNEIRSLGYPRRFSASVVMPRENASSLLYVYGGTAGSGITLEDGVLVYDDETNEWNEKIGGDPFPLISRHCMVRIDNTTLMSISGRNGNNEYSPEVTLHDTTTREWNFGRSRQS